MNRGPRNAMVSRLIGNGEHGFFGETEKFWALA
jgi:hypothetical protein